MSNQKMILLPIHLCIIGLVNKLVFVVEFNRVELCITKIILIEVVDYEAINI